MFDSRARNFLRRVEDTFMTTSLKNFLTIFRLSKTGPGSKDQCLTGGLVGEINHCSIVICHLLVKISASGFLSFPDENFLVSHLPIFFRNISLFSTKKVYNSRSAERIFTPIVLF